MASSFTATAASQRKESLPPFRLLSLFFHFKAAAEEKHFLRGGCGGRKALLRAEEERVGAKGEEEGREAREAVAMLLLSTGAIIECLEC